MNIVEFRDEVAEYKLSTNKEIRFIKMVNGNSEIAAGELVVKAEARKELLNYIMKILGEMITEDDYYV